MISKKNLFKFSTIFLLLGLVFFSGCQGFYYSTMETLGSHKRDILVDRVKDCADRMDKAKQEFQALNTKLEKITKADISKVDSLYKELNSQSKKCHSKAIDLDRRVNNIRTVGKDLFREWEEELEEYHNETFRRSSEKRMEERRRKYLETVHLLKSAQKYSEPALSSASDYVLFLKHNLNAQALNSLDNEIDTVQQKIKFLVEKMELATDNARNFLVEMDFEKESEQTAKLVP